MNFISYIHQRRISNSPAGDFTKDARRDDNMPDARTWRELETYLRSKRASEPAIDAAKSVWKSFVSARNGNAKRRG